MHRFLLLAAFSTGCLSIDAEIEESCVTRQDIEIDGVTATKVSRDFVIDDLSDIHELLDYDATLQFARAAIRPTSGVANLDFIAFALVAVEGSPVYGCQGDCSSGELPAAVVKDATQYLAAESLAIGLTVTGELPATPWTVDIDVCMRGTASYEVTP